MLRCWVLIVVVFFVNPHRCEAIDYAGADRLAASFGATGVTAMAARGDCLYLAGSGFLKAYDIGATGEPVLVATCSTPSGFTQGMSIDGDYLFLQSTSQTLLVDLRQPAAPAVLAAVSATGSLALWGNRLLVGTSTTPRMFDLSDRQHPLECARLDLGGKLFGKIGGDILTFSRFATGNMAYEAKLMRRTLTDSYALGDSVLVYSIPHSYENDYSPSHLQKVADRVRVQLRHTYTDYDGGCRLPPCTYSYTVAFDLADLDPSRVSGAQSITMTEPTSFLAMNDLYDFTVINPDGCTFEYLRGRPRGGVAGGTPQIDLRSCTAGLACGSDTRLFVAAAGVVRVFDFAGDSEVDTTRVHTHDPMTAMTCPSQAGSRVAWVEEAHDCRMVAGPEYNDFYDEISTYLTIADLDAGFPLRHRILLAGPYLNPIQTAILLDPMRYVVAEARITYPTAADWSLRFHEMDAAGPYVTLPDIGADSLLRVGNSLLAASGRTLSNLDVTEPAAPVLHWQLPLPMDAGSLFPLGDGVAVAGAATGLALLRSTGPGDWQLATVIPSAERVVAVEGRGSQMSVALSDRIDFYDIADLANPVHIDNLRAMNGIKRFAMSGPYVYVACGSAGLLVYERNPGVPARYLGGYPFDSVDDVRIENGRLLIGTSQGLITLPLQDGDPLPAYAPQLSAVVGEYGEAILEWRSPRQFGLVVQLYREHDGGRLGIPFETSGDRCRAVDDRALGLPGASYLLLASEDGSAWYEADRVELNLEASTTQLLPAWPNPFNPATTIRYRLAVAGPVRMAVHDLAGRRVRLLVDRREGQGTQETGWDGHDDAGRPAAAGTYVLKLEAGGMVRTSKITMMR